MNARLLSSACSAAALLAAVTLLPGCRSAKSTAGLTSHEPDWQLMGLSLATPADAVRKLILHQWPDAQFQVKTPPLGGTGSATVPGAPLLLARPSSSMDALSEELAVQFDYAGRIVFIAHGRTYPFLNAPPEDAFLKGFARQYAPGIETGSGDLTFYSGPSGVTHLAGTNPMADYTFGGPQPLAQMIYGGNGLAGTVNLQPQGLSIDDSTDRRTDHEILAIQTWHYNIGGRLSGYVVELENEPASQAWQNEQTHLRKQAADRLGQVYQGTQY